MWPNRRNSRLTETTVFLPLSLLNVVRVSGGLWWTQLLSSFCPAILPGPPLQKSKFIVAINWTGITFLDEREKRLLELSFPEVTGVNSSRLSCSHRCCGIRGFWKFSWCGHCFVSKGLIKQLGRLCVCWHWKGTLRWAGPKLRTWASWLPCSSVVWLSDPSMLWHWRMQVAKVRAVPFLSHIPPGSVRLLWVLTDSLAVSSLRWPYPPQLQERGPHYHY